MQDLVRKDSIEELCGHRARALALYEQMREAFAEARAAQARACIGIAAHINNVDHALSACYALGEPVRWAKQVRQTVDRDMWRAFVVNTPLGSLMDTEERKKFEDGLKGDDVPEATPANVEATLRRLAGEAPAIFRRGLVNAFSHLSGEYRSHDGFKIGARIVLSGVVSYDRAFNWLREGYRCGDELQDVDRVMHVLDGKPAPEYQQGLQAALRAAIAGFRNGGPMECETEYWRLRFFKNGNGHLFPKRADLVENANKLIAEHYGAVVGAAPDVASHRGHTAHKVDTSDMPRGFFPTPAAVVEEMMELADIQAGHSVLEPSAGVGNIARVLAQSAAGDRLTCYEIDHSRAVRLRDAVGPDAIIKVGDFLDAPESTTYDRIVMNPPFERQQDMLHVLAAFGRLSPGGRLVSVMSSAVQGGSSSLAQAVRSAVERYGHMVELPPRSFRESGTDVNTVLVVLDKPALTVAPSAITPQGSLFAA